LVNKGKTWLTVDWNGAGNGGGKLARKWGISHGRGLNHDKGRGYYSEEGQAAGNRVTGRNRINPTPLMGAYLQGEKG